MVRASHHMPHRSARKFTHFAFALFVALGFSSLAYAQNSGDIGIPPPKPLPEFGSDVELEGEDVSTPQNSGGFARTTMPTVLYDIKEVPRPVARMHQLLLDAALSGNVEALRPLIGTGANITQLSLSGFDGDPIEYLRGLSGDDQGHEILAIILDILDAGFVRLDEGEESETFVWPYFAAGPITELTATQRVELFRIVTSGDVEDMKAFGAYNFYRLGITPKGQWTYFVIGD